MEKYAAFSIRLNLGKVEFPLDAFLFIFHRLRTAARVCRPLAEPEEVVVRGAVEPQHVLLGAGDAAETHHLRSVEGGLRKCCEGGGRGRDVICSH